MDIPKARGLVLVVEDEPMVLSFAHRALRTMGFDTLLAATGDQGLQLFTANSGRLSLVLLDFMMPFMDGLALIPLLRGIRPDMPIILTSGHYAPDAGLDQWGVLFLPKPYGPRELRGAVETALDGRPVL